MSPSRSLLSVVWLLTSGLYTAMLCIVNMVLEVIMHTIKLTGTYNGRTEMVRAGAVVLDWAIHGYNAVAVKEKSGTVVRVSQILLAPAK